jgi:hypothetical protein
MGDATHEEKILDLPPSRELLVSLGAINLLWASIETYVSAALFSLLTIDEHDFAILLGRLEITPKLKKMHQILEHRGDIARVKSVAKLMATVETLRPDRNALTHGYYEGVTKKGEYLFFLMGDFLFDKKEGSARKMRVFTNQDLADHAEQTLNLFVRIKDAFDSPEMMKLFAGQFRVPKYLRSSPRRAKGGKKHGPQPQS